MVNIDQRLNEKNIPPKYSGHKKLSPARRDLIN